MIMQYSKPQYTRNLLKVTALLENGMYYIPVCGMYASYIYVLILGEMHGIVGRAWCYDRWYVYTYH